VRQRGCSQGVLWRLEAAAVLEVEHRDLGLRRREARFTQVQGDFKVGGGGAAQRRGLQCVRHRARALPPILGAPRGTASNAARAPRPLPPGRNYLVGGWLSLTRVPRAACRQSCGTRSQLCLASPCQQR
jgi:hypothetical protein